MTDDPQKELQKKWSQNDQTKRREKPKGDPEIALKRKALAFLSGYFERTTYSESDRELSDAQLDKEIESSPGYTPEQIAAVMGLYNRIQVLEGQLADCREAGTQAIETMARLESHIKVQAKQISDAGWEKDQNSPYRMGL